MQRIRRRLIAAGVGLVGSGLVGCSAETALLRRVRPPGLPRQVELDDTPFYPQDDYQCGPAALAMVLGRIGLTVTPEQLASQVFLPGRQGSLQIEMLSGARRNAALAIEIPSTLEALMRETAAGHPVVVLLNLGLSWAPSWHYAVVIGYDLDEEVFLLRSGPMKRQALPFRTFELTWNRAGRWAFVALPAGQLAVTVDEGGTTHALVAFEKAAAPEYAAMAYRSALVRWPGSLTLQMGLGNSLYRLRDLHGAEKAFRMAAHSHDAAVAWNNLANVLLELGHPDEASRAAEKAVSLGGPTERAARETLGRLRARQ
ncbi:PA2778 family cysteine peptidase [Zoogloea sp.]|uniref:PA2778 family cysteine peptidase n=1 Tax=Zoogloea sp. TaxID=49181 RepID=UPI002620030F|nr:PA2778 family cysteine peptidase [Zoogloea sp.]MDD3353703.1 PA2778 family cysteine peptidase [Zoogloea sp.]